MHLFHLDYNAIAMSSKKPFIKSHCTYENPFDFERQIGVFTPFNEGLNWDYNTKIKKKKKKKKTANQNWPRSQFRLAFKIKCRASSPSFSLSCTIFFYLLRSRTTQSEEDDDGSLRLHALGQTN